MGRDPWSPRSALGLAVGALAASNVLSNRVLGPTCYVPWNVTMAGALYGLARRSGLDDVALGLGHSHLGRGLRMGGIGAAVVTAVHTAVAVSHGGQAAFDDARVDGTGIGILLWTVAVRIPVGTVALEEVAFRAVLPALVWRATGRRWAEVAAPAVLFGLWHLLPSVDLQRANTAVSKTSQGLHPAVTPLVAVVIMSAAGAGLQYLRSTAAHVAAPALVHTVVNTLGFATAWWLRRTNRG